MWQINYPNSAKYIELNSTLTSTPKSWFQALIYLILLIKSAFCLKVLTITFWNCRQCFRGSEEIDVSGLARFVMKQRSVGSVVTQSPVTDDDDDDEELGGHDGEVFGLATIVRLRETEVADQIIRYLTKSVTASDPRGQLSRLLSSSDIDVGSG